MSLVLKRILGQDDRRQWKFWAEIDKTVEKIFSGPRPPNLLVGGYSKSRESLS